MLKRKIGVAAVLAVLTAGAFAASASAQCPPLGSPSSPMINFDANAFAYETNYNPVGFNSSAGSNLTIVGIIDQFQSPLAFLTPSDPTKEYTFVISGLVSLGTVATPSGPTTFYTTNSNGGAFAIYEGSPENAPLAGAMPLPGGPAVPGYFQDGTALLTGQLCGFTTSVSQTGSLQPNGSFVARYHFTGGTLFAAMGNAEANFSGNWCVRVGGCTPTGYSAHPNGKWDSPPSTAATRATWGKLKSLYR